MAGGAPLAETRVSGVRGIGFITLLSANCGIISYTCLGRGNVPISGVPTCSAVNITRLMFTFVSRLTMNITLRSSTMGGNR